MATHLVDDRMIDEPMIADAVRRLSAYLSIDLADETDPLLLVVLNGAFVFAADLLRLLRASYQVDFIQVRSYDGMTRQSIEVSDHSLAHVKGRTVYLIDDIFDSGVTLGTLRWICIAHGAARVKSVVLLRKLRPRPAVLPPQALDAPDFTGLEIADRFVVGYGLDYNGRYRQLSYIAAVESVNNDGTVQFA